jgi:hypothetical protein
MKLLPIARLPGPPVAKAANALGSPGPTKVEDGHAG